MTGIIVLAAGESRRLGQPKQLVEWEGEPLLRRAVRVALEAELGPVAVVLGAADEPCRKALGGMPVTIAWNPDWQTGMGSSIATGLAALAEQPLDSVAILLCDQPFVDVALLCALEGLSGGGEIAACRYHDELGPPAVFPRERFEELLSLGGSGGAKSILRNAAGVASIDAPQAGIDIDTPEDLERIVSP